MPVKNAGLYLEECITSVLNQTYETWELCAVDDHSSDSSLHLLRKFEQSEERVKVLSNKGNGIIDALKTAMTCARGDLITRMDADDIMPQNKLGLLSKKLQEKGPGHIVTGMVTYFSAAGVGPGYKAYEDWLNALAQTNTHFEEIYKECVLPSAGWMMYRSDFERVGGVGELYPEDYDFAFRCRLGGLEVVSLNEVIHKWRDHGARASRNDPQYKENAFLPLKWHYFQQSDRGKGTLVVWGAGSKGKELVRLIGDQEIIWVSDNPRKVGHVIYGHNVTSRIELDRLENYQVIVAVSQPEGKQEIEQELITRGLIKNRSYFMFF